MAFRNSALLVVVLIAAQSSTLTSALSAEVQAAKLGHPARNIRGNRPVPQDDFRLKFREAVNEALGEENGIHHERLADIRKAISQMWASLVKSPNGLVSLRTMRYAVHRYLLQAYGISFVGLEAQQTNSTLAEAEILTKRAPEYVRRLLEGKSSSGGFSIDDAVVLIATLESLVADEGRDMIAQAYKTRGMNNRDTLNFNEFQHLLESFVVSWIVGAYGEHGTLPANEVDNIRSFTDGWIHNFEFSRSKSLQERRPWSQGSSWSPLERRFSFADVTQVADNVQKSFAEYNSWWCSSTKEQLVHKDTSRTGRVKLSGFHQDALDGEFHFGESKEYLRELGALDETSTRLGPQVIITNYLQAASNCIVQAPHYRVCCQNECEGIFAELEESVGHPLATPGQLLAVIANMTGSLEEDDIKVTPFLVKQLEDIAEASQGKVPIHGRLFAQWLHYVFPHECPFPHKSGTTRAVFPREFSGYQATAYEMMTHVKQPNVSVNSTNDALNQEPVEKAVWMSQWTPEEELFADYAHLRSPWEASNSALLKPMLLLLAGAVVVGSRYWRQARESRKGFDLPIAKKAHYI